MAEIGECHSIIYNCRIYQISQPWTLNVYLDTMSTLHSKRVNVVSKAHCLLCASLLVVLLLEVHYV